MGSLGQHGGVYTLDSLLNQFNHDRGGRVFLGTTDPSTVGTEKAYDGDIWWNGTTLRLWATGAWVAITGGGAVTFLSSAKWATD